MKIGGFFLHCSRLLTCKMIGMIVLNGPKCPKWDESSTTAEYQLLDETSTPQDMFLMKLSIPKNDWHIGMPNMAPQLFWSQNDWPPTSYKWGYATPINGCLVFLQPYLQGEYRLTPIYVIAAVDPPVAGAQRRGAFGATHWTLQWSVDGARLCILRRLWKNRATRQNQDFDGRNPANQLRLVVFSRYFIIYRILYIPGISSINSMIGMIGGSILDIFAMDIQYICSN